MKLNQSNIFDEGRHIPLEKSVIMKTIKIKKGQILQQRGDLNNKVYQVESGLLAVILLATKERSSFLCLHQKDG